MRKALAFINPRLSTRNVGDIFIEDSTKRILAYDPRRRWKLSVDAAVGERAGHEKPISG